MQMVSGAPIWVWPVLAILVALGFRASKRRETSMVLVLLLPLAGLIVVRSLFQLSPQALVWACFLMLYGIGAALGWRMQRRWLIEKRGFTLILAGEWFTLFCLLAIFALNYANGMARAIAPALHASAIFGLLFAAVAGALAGIFAGRALYVINAR